MAQVIHQGRVVIIVEVIVTCKKIVPAGGQKVRGDLIATGARPLIPRKFTEEKEDPLSFTFSESEDEGEDVRMIQVNDEGSQTNEAEVVIQGVPVVGILDSGADITIMGAEMFKKVASVAKLRKQDFKKPDKVPRTYNHKPFPWMDE